MDDFFPVMLDRPSNGQIACSTSYGIFAFSVFPFMLVLLTADPNGIRSLAIWYDFGYHIANFLVMLLVFCTYLKEAFWNLKLYFKNVALTVAICVVLILGYTFVMQKLSYYFRSNELLFATYGILPLSEMELVNLSSNLVYVKPLWGSLCLVLLAPLTVSCIYYASIFAPICCEKPVLAYIVTAFIIALPRVVAAFTLFDPAEELFLYLAQLPVHLLCCWSYQKTDTVWTPMAILFLTNLISCVLYLFVA